MSTAKGNDDLIKQTSAEFLRRLGLSPTGGKEEVKPLNAQLVEPFQRLCAEAIGALVRRGLNPEQGTADASSRPEGLRPRLEAWIEQGGEERRTASYFAVEFLSNAARRVLGLKMTKQGFAAETHASAWVVFQEWVASGGKARLRDMDAEVHKCVKKYLMEKHMEKNVQGKADARSDTAKQQTSAGSGTQGASEERDSAYEFTPLKERGELAGGAPAPELTSRGLPSGAVAPQGATRAAAQAAAARPGAGVGTTQVRSPQAAAATPGAVRASQASTQPPAAASQGAARTSVQAAAATPGAGVGASQASTQPPAAASQSAARTSVQAAAATPGAVGASQASTQPPAAASQASGGVASAQTADPARQAPSVEPAPEEPQPRAVDTTDLWKYVPVPEGPDKHTEYAVARKAMPNGFTALAARARGRKHKHEGTNCDDWFALDHAGDWSFLAVSDGAGSCAFSRVGSMAACGAAVESLRQSLGELKLPEMPMEGIQPSEERVFADETLERVQLSLHQAMRDARAAMDAAVEERAADPAYAARLGRALVLKDLSATLLLAVHTRAVIAGTSRDVVMTCQIGDGMIAAVSQAFSLRVLAKPDSGAFSGETEFLTSPRKLEDASLRANTHLFVGALRTLMLMTDGVSDDYFPEDPGMKLLYADLCLNRVLPLPPAGTQGLEEALKKQGKTPEDLALDPKTMTQLRLSGEGKSEHVLVRSVRTMARAAGIEPEAFLASPALLHEIARGEPMIQGAESLPPEEQLLLWIDSYVVRGSFDDRTMIVLYEEM
ncbi:hypothetical protein NNJEOMEG_04011 [Fundidesulfovibrio magnetotacticus]|uniref:PPM-type phosphatase domain-containing protein n=1 Tax=Fundidesulfovibrio magnetotacticus TaxID=2730080 RepID=A0A6V8M019_9BACT|nr:PP2C family serine/threonine-protein phosphatase [Fundidesulfovibrio magnetotacticus]GFK96131.1 hypothetical protein NNJEOMEG_04011 [Fundidesulfovibrio magnetotacticus]